MSWPFSADSPAVDEDTWLVAKYQRWVITSILLGLLLVGFDVVVAFELLALPPRFSPVVELASRPLSAFMAISIFMLARQFYSDSSAMVFALFIWLPFVGLLLLLYINQKATRFLKGRGIHVRLLGASLNG